MKKNMGTSDRWVRFSIAAALFVYAYWKMSWIAALFGVFTLFEAVMSWCIFYQIIGKNTCPISKRKL